MYGCSILIKIINIYIQGEVNITNYSIFGFIKFLSAG